jgi:hypothetical protein
MQKCALRKMPKNSKNTENSMNAENSINVEKCRTIPLMQKNSINSKKIHHDS